jgi:hypothetical protein
MRCEKVNRCNSQIEWNNNDNVKRQIHCVNKT